MVDGCSMLLIEVTGRMTRVLVSRRIQEVVGIYPICGGKQHAILYIK
jgi:hypothetical protein